MASSLSTQTARLTGNMVFQSKCQTVITNIFYGVCCALTAILTVTWGCWTVPLSAGRRRGLSICGLNGRTGEARAELCFPGFYGSQAQGGGLREGGWRQQLQRNQSQMNRDPSLIPRLCEMQWQPRNTYTSRTTNCVLTSSSSSLDVSLLMRTFCFWYVTRNVQFWQ